MMRRAIGAFIFGLTLIAGPGVAASDSVATPVPVTILYTCDMRGHFRPYRFSEDIDVRDGDPLKRGVEYGGMAAYAGYVNRVRRERAADSGVVLLFDCGNTFISNAESLYFQGKPVVEMMNRMGYHACVPGNLDYNEGTAMLRQISRMARFPLVTNHIFQKSTGDRPDFLKPHILLDAGGLKVGVIGITYPTFHAMMKTSRIRDLQIVDPKTEIVPSVRALEQAGAELIVLLSHGHPAYMSRYLDAAPSIHVALSAWLGSLKEAIGTDPGGMEFYFDKRYRRTILGHWIDSHYTLGRVDFLFDRKNRAVYNARSAIVYLMTNSVAADTEVEAMVEKYSKLYVDLVASRMNDVIGQATGDFSMEKIRDTQCCSLGRLVMGAMREYTGADIAFMNFWGIRRVIKKGPVSVKTVLDVVPFDNHLATARVIGRDLPKLDWMFLGGTRGSHRSGVTFHGNPGSVTDLQVDGAPVDPDREYLVATADFVVEEGGLPSARDLKIWDIKLQDLLIDYIKKHNAITPSGAERIPRFRY